MNPFEIFVRKRHLIRVNLRSPRRGLNSFLAVLSYRLKLLRPWGLPVAVDLEPTNFCNLRCDHCQVTHWRKKRDRLTLEKLRSWIKYFRRACRVKLQGMGEPFLNDELPAIIRELEKEGVNIEVVTNGSIMTRDIYEVVTRTRNLSIAVSLDAAEKGVFEKIRTGGDFERVKENIARLASSRSRSSRVAVCMVAFEENEDQIEPVIRLAGVLGVDEVYLQLMIINFGQPWLNGKTVRKRLQLGRTKEYFKARLRAVARESGTTIEILDESFDAKNPCPWPWLGTYIDTEGYVIPCCRVANAEVCNFGNLNRKDFMTIWYSAAYQKFRERIRKHDVPDFCGSCYGA